MRINKLRTIKQKNVEKIIGNTLNNFLNAHFNQKETTEQYYYEIVLLFGYLSIQQIVEINSNVIVDFYSKKIQKTIYDACGSNIYVIGEIVENLAIGNNLLLSFVHYQEQKKKQAKLIEEELSKIIKIFSDNNYNKSLIDILIDFYFDLTKDITYNNKKNNKSKSYFSKNQASAFLTSIGKTVQNILLIEKLPYILGLLFLILGSSLTYLFDDYKKTLLIEYDIKENKCTRIDFETNARQRFKRNTVEDINSVIDTSKFKEFYFYQISFTNISFGKTIKKGLIYTTSNSTISDSTILYSEGFWNSQFTGSIINKNDYLKIKEFPSNSSYSWNILSNNPLELHYLFEENELSLKKKGIITFLIKNKHDVIIIFSFIILIIIVLYLFSISNSKNKLK